tara:strand:+ start:622 stop:1566 length:945 start_codon:yes stop_codon:yes gene_type:complete
LSIHETPPDIFADSGAFSAWTQGVEISVDDYAGWLHQWHDHLTVYCNLDVINDPQGTDINQRALEAHGLSPLPVWHVRSDRKAFSELCEEYRYVALGGMVGTPWRRLMPTLIWAMQESQKYSTVLHGLGLTSNEPLKQLPFYSVDSSSWGSGFRYGNVRIYDGRRYVTAKLGDAADWRKHSSTVKRLGFDPIRFVNGEAKRDEIAALSALSTMIYEAAIRKRIGLVPLPDDGRKPYVRQDTGDGLLQFLADTDPANHVFAAGGLRQYLATGGAKDDLYAAANGARIYLAGAVQHDIANVADHTNSLTTPIGDSS